MLGLKVTLVGRPAAIVSRLRIDNTPLESATITVIGLEDWWRLAFRQIP